jgi:two-component system CheB/CheR fusion protein
MRKKTFIKITSKPTFPIVCIGASAGGLEAFKDFLYEIPKKTGMAYVYVQHLDPHYKSALVDLLSRATDIPIQEAKNNTLVKPDHIYVFPPSKNMSIVNGALKLFPRQFPDAKYLPIDFFMRSLAEDQKSSAIGIILSGTASDGTIGLRTIKANGGITFAQDKTAKYDSMPRSAIVAGYVDRILPPAKIAKELVNIKSNSFAKIAINESPKELSKNKPEINKIIDLLQKETGTDFSHYKPGTIERRINRRLLLKKINKLSDYTGFLKNNSPEINELHSDILISVTNFFRDPPLFEALKHEVFPKLIKGKSGTQKIRVWVPGCSTGEEAYSIAICLLEYLEEKKINTPIQIFATDLNKDSIDKARNGIYLKSSVEAVSPTRLLRYFTKDGDRYQISKSVREMCIFAVHNITSDPTFSRLDLISCRNLLIYLDKDLQKKVLNTFHYALNPKGYLVLGLSETVGSLTDKFLLANQKFKIFSKKSGTAAQILGRHVEKTGRNITDIYQNKIEFGENMLGEFDLHKEADRIILKKYIPSGVLIDENMKVVRFYGATGPYIEQSTGEPTLNILKMVKDDLLLALNNAIKTAKTGKAFVKKRLLVVNSIKDSREVDIEIITIASPSKDIYYLIIFKEVEPGGLSLKEKSQTGSKNNSKQAIKQNFTVKQLERELGEARRVMKTLLAERELLHEKVQTVNEEALSRYEEFHTVNEELETSKEELQSVNEELTTTNQELINRNDELKEARNFAEAIIETVREPLLVLGSDLRVITSNRSYFELFKTAQKDTIGIMIYDLGDGQWDVPPLRKLLGKLMHSDTVFENFNISHTFPNIGLRTIALNARKIERYEEKGQDLILLAFEDITDRRKIEKQKDNFMSMASHELKTPITSIKAYSQILRMKADKEGSDNKELLKKMDAQVDMLTKLINELLDITKAQKGKLEFNMDKFNFDRLTKEMVEMMRNTITTHKFSVTGKTGKMVIGDKDRIGQVFINLLTNAVKFSPNSKKITINLSRDKKWVIAKIQDFGNGIPKKHIKGIFNRYYRVSQKSGLAVSGLGIGLYISNEIIKRHHGKISVESEEGVGSTFTVFLPFP